MVYHEDKRHVSTKEITPENHWPKSFSLTEFPDDVNSNAEPILVFNEISF